MGLSGCFGRNWGSRFSINNKNVEEDLVMKEFWNTIQFVSQCNVADGQGTLADATQPFPGAGGVCGDGPATGDVCGGGQ